MSTTRIEYDADNKRIKVYRSFSDAKSLVPKEELKTWTDAIERGEDEDGREVESVRYVFDDEETATYNQQSIAYAGIETYVDVDGEERQIGDDPDFSVREDFGIEDADQ